MDFIWWTNVDILVLTKTHTLCILGLILCVCAGDQTLACSKLGKHCTTGQHAQPLGFILYVTEIYGL
jgi:hypothetical protein